MSWVKHWRRSTKPIFHYKRDYYLRFFTHLFLFDNASHIETERPKIGESAQFHFSLSNHVNSFSLNFRKLSLMRQACRTIPVPANAAGPTQLEPTLETSKDRVFGWDRQFSASHPEILHWNYVRVVTRLVVVVNELDPKRLVPHNNRLSGHGWSIFGKVDFIVFSIFRNYRLHLPESHRVH